MGTTRSVPGLSITSDEDAAAVGSGSACPGTRLDTKSGTDGPIRGAGKSSARPSAGYIVYDRRKARRGHRVRALPELLDEPKDEAMLVDTYGGCTGAMLPKLDPDGLLDQLPDEAPAPLTDTGSDGPASLTFS